MKEIDSVDIIGRGYLIFDGKKYSNEMITVIKEGRYLNPEESNSKKVNDYLFGKFNPNDFAIDEKDRLCKIIGTHNDELYVQFYKKQFEKDFVYMEPFKAENLTKSSKEFKIEEYNENGKHYIIDTKKADEELKKFSLEFEQYVNIKDDESYDCCQVINVIDGKILTFIAKGQQFDIKIFSIEKISFKKRQ